jgi:4-amino-4-deoxy-L-arabinose transferase-like glycosyltransferase
MPSSPKWPWLQLVLLLCLLIRLPIWDLPINNDTGANAYHARLILAGEPLYGTHHPGHHMPGIYYIYALAFALFGDSILTIKLLILVWIAATAFLLYLLASRASTWRAGLLAVVFYFLLSQHDWLKGVSGEMDIFANLPVAGALWLAVRLAAARHRHWKYLWVGVLLGLAVCIKLVNILLLGAGIAVILYSAWLDRKEGALWKTPLQRLTWVCLGFVMPLLLSLAYFSSQGLGESFLSIFLMGQGYLQELERDYLAGVGLDIPVLGGLLVPFLQMAVINPALLLLALWGSLKAVAVTLKPQAHSPNTALVSIAIFVWLILAWIAAGLTRIGYTHYLFTLAPPLSILAAFQIDRLLFVPAKTRSLCLQYAASALVFLLVVSSSLVVDGRLYQAHIQYKSGALSKEQFIRQGLVDGEYVVSGLLVSEYIQEHASADARVYYWSDNVNFYYLVERRSPIDSIWPLYAGFSQPSQDIFAPQTQYIIVGESLQRSLPEWFLPSLSQNYSLEEVISEQQIFKRK